MAAKADPYLSQAQLAGQVRYQPQQQALKALLAQAVQTYLDSVASSKSAARAVRSSALQAKPEIARDMVPVGASVDAANAMVAPQAEGSPFGGAIAHDAAATHNRLAQMLAAAQVELTSRAQNAAAGEQYQVSKLGQDYAGTQAKIGQQLADLAGQQGSFEASQLNSLHQAAAGRAVTKRGQDLSHADRQASQKLTQRGQDLAHADRQKSAADRKNKVKSPYLPNVSQSKAQGTIDSAVSDARQMLGVQGYPAQAKVGGKTYLVDPITGTASGADGKPLMVGGRPFKAQKVPVYDPAGVARLLTNGRPKSSAYPPTVTLGGKTYSVDENTGMALDGKGAPVPGPDGKPYRVAKVDLPPIKKYDPAVVQAAIDKITQGGQYSPETVKRLRRQGIRTPGPARPTGATAYGGPH